MPGIEAAEAQILTLASLAPSGRTTVHPACGYADPYPDPVSIRRPLEWFLRTQRPCPGGVPTPIDERGPQQPNGK